MASCGAQVGGGVVTFGCDLEGNHDGPHRAIENPRSVRERKKWEMEQSHRKSGLGDFQGVPLTSQENLVGPPEVDEPPMEPVEAEFDEEGEVKSFKTVTEPEKQREGDQPLPTTNQGEFVQERIIRKVRKLHEQGSMTDETAERLIADMKQSMELGIQRYGTPLQTFNGRDTLQDAIEEVRDTYVYLSSMEQAREATRDELVNAVSMALMDAVSNTPAGEGMTAEKIAVVAVDTILRATGGIGG